ncbi:methylenetetrahydrofolate--tRNA-(uracil(54)-C(5))-methyltransferase (FADH(2)-oxidizing) TrmFO [Hydrogenoanaerobacterium sp.]|uniref:methylenetetrahydrofolate--tRNA-(uracil(54)- C(5))-methyltransferase (FADH(2)-oxidizing) TrmFO n=1 Tax=Hydrogenoanaerobacterium sp. TaxID=2953763 RepID=UPI00289D6626|nr:methylenetetrahydrofolate--tRNA-(uracil(54)-C(5))-methyltransferase (FADH(2)-oxidizing) TrmFO [Hydrogenoanaerobacterium sp.]
MSVSVIGAGLAGCEAAWQLANHGIKVRLHEMKPQKFSPAHKYNGFAELVCSNSLKAMRIESAAGLLKEEMRRLGSLIIECADATAVSAGGALAVDREQFSNRVTAKISDHPNIEVVTGEVTGIPDEDVIIATGPLTSDAFSTTIKSLLGGEYLSFYDAAAPIVTFDSIDQDKVFFAARYDRGDADYINCPMNKEEYESFHSALVSAESVELKSFENMTVYEGCMPVEVLAKRGTDAIRYGPLKPVGLRDPNTGHRPWAVVQLRKENAEGSLYNLVGFQTNLRFPEQKRVFSMIPGLEHADFMRYGVMHRNTFIDSPRLLDSTYRLKKDSRIYFAGQITGVEGYIESAASGILAGINLARRLQGGQPLILPRETMLGALTAYISDESVASFQPMGCNMGILPPLGEKIRDKSARYLALAQRGLQKLDEQIATIK